MQTHEDRDATFMRRLRERADQMLVDKASEITAGRDGEEELARWTHADMSVRHLPDDEQKILRVSIGGGPRTPISLNYCVIRGDRHDCIELIEKALTALRRGPK